MKLRSSYLMLCCAFLVGCNSSSDTDTDTGQVVAIQERSSALSSSSPAGNYSDLLNDESALRFLEAEDATLSGSMVVANDTSANGGKYVSVGIGSESSNTDNDFAEFTVWIAREGNYKVIANALGPNGKSNSFFAQINQGAQYVWDISNNNTWNSASIEDRGTGEVIEHLAVGFHTLRISSREAGSQLDYVNFELQGDTTGDTDAPILAIDTPATNNAVLSSVATMSGRAVDVGSGGIESVSVSVFNDNGDYLDFSTGAFKRQFASSSAFLGNAGSNSTDWSISTPGMADGNYTLIAKTVDGAGNHGVPITSEFKVSAVSTGSILYVQAEDSVLNGAMKVVTDTSAIGGSYVSVPEDGESSNTENDYMDFYVNLEQSGEYKIAARVSGPHGSANSFFAQVDNAEQYVWDISKTNQWSTEYVSDRGNGDVSLYLGAGEHTLRVSVRESGAKLDYIEFVLQSAGPVLYVEAEDSLLNGAMKAVSDSSAIAGSYVSVPKGGESSNPANDYMEFTVRLEEAGEYMMSARVLGPNGSANSFLAQLNDGAQYLWDITKTNGWTTGYISDRGNGNVMEYLDAGEHKLRIGVRESGARLDYVKFQLQQDATGPVMYVEAEDSNMNGAMKAVADSSATAGSYVSVPEGGESSNLANDYMDFNVSVQIAGEYKIAARVLGPNGSANSFFAQINSGTKYLWDIPRNNQWSTEYISNRGGSDVSVFLGAGDHTLRVGVRESGARLDYIDFQLQGDFESVEIAEGGSTETPGDTTTVQETPGDTTTIQIPTESTVVAEAGEDSSSSDTGTDDDSDNTLGAALPSEEDSDDSSGIVEAPKAKTSNVRTFYANIACDSCEVMELSMNWDLDVAGYETVSLVHSKNSAQRELADFDLDDNKLSMTIKTDIDFADEGEHCFAVRTTDNSNQEFESESVCVEFSEQG